MIKVGTYEGWDNVKLNVCVYKFWHVEDRMPFRSQGTYIQYNDALTSVDICYDLNDMADDDRYEYFYDILEDF